MLRVTSVLGNRQRLDGGAMFGSVPRPLWERWAPPDEVGRIELACRAFLVEDGQRKILVETGIGAFFEPQLRGRYGVIEEEHVLLGSLAGAGIAAEDIDVVLLSHLHFDHAGGLLSAWRPDAEPTLVFPRARFVVGERAFERASRPHPRDRASFIELLPRLLEESGRLTIVGDGQTSSAVLGERIALLTSDGHTPGMLLPLLLGTSRRALFAADLVPGTPWVHLPVTMGYDRYPELLIDEKRSFYESLRPGGLLLFTHDPAVAAAELALDGAGRYVTCAGRAELAGHDLD